MFVDATILVVGTLMKKKGKVEQSVEKIIQFLRKCSGRPVVFGDGEKEILLGEIPGLIYRPEITGRFNELNRMISIVAAKYPYPYTVYEIKTPKSSADVRAAISDIWED